MLESGCLTLREHPLLAPAGKSGHERIRSVVVFLLHLRQPTPDNDAGRRQARASRANAIACESKQEEQPGAQ